METVATGSSARAETPMRTVVLASSTGTAFEWYDFFIYGAVAPTIAKNFFSQLDPTAGLLVALAIFATGFLFRPLGALIFGRLGDRFGRKGAFLATVVIMGGATFSMGLLPTYDQIGVAAVAILIFLRVLQGTAVGGEYGGAAIYVAEHAPVERRGMSTGWIQASAAFGLLGAQAIVLLVRSQMAPEDFDAWGWRLPFLLSAGLLAVSIWMRLQLKESPEFEKARTEGRLSQAPYADVFLKWKNMKVVLLALFSFLMAQGAIWWCAFFYTQIFLESSIKLSPILTNVVLLAATLVSIPLYVFFAGLSDKIGRKPIILFGIGLALVAVFPSFQFMARGANPALLQAMETTPVTVHADPATCSFQFDVLGRARYTTGCDLARNALRGAGVGFSTVDAPAGSATEVRVGGAVVPIADGDAAKINTDVRAALAQAGYPATAADDEVNWPLIALGLIALVVAATALYGPQAAALVELFPTNVRYTALSVPYHVGVGWVGGFMPFFGVALVAATGDLFAGLWYLAFFSAISFVCCLFVFPETRGRPLN
jgi:hypothetical protein